MTAAHDRDEELGMGRRITRRDFLDGVALTVGDSRSAARYCPPADPPPTRRRWRRRSWRHTRRRSPA